MIDFERCKQTESPGNVTQFLEFISRSKEELGKKGIKVNVEGIRRLGEEYRKNKNFESVLSEIKNL